MHDDDTEHYHDDGSFVPSYDDTISWTTVGLDVGSSTAQIVFSRVVLARRESYYVVVERRTLHESEVILTPYSAPRIIDRDALSAFIEREFAAARLARDAIDTGAVILTGLALTATNARAIAEAISDESGKFVAVSAGDLLEARLAASGAGLPVLSAGRGGTLLHIDVGGGTTKLSTWRAGRMLGVAAIDVGARLLTLDPQRRIERIEPPLQRLAESLGLTLSAGDPVDPATAARLAQALAQQVLSHAGVFAARGIAPAPGNARDLLRTAPLWSSGTRPRIDVVLFSGGVSEYIYGRERRTFGDLGPELGAAIREQIDRAGIKVLPFERGIRATVLGASQHSTQLSGNTVFISDGAPLPLRNIPVLVPHLDLTREVLEGATLTGQLEQALVLHASSPIAAAPALAIRWSGTATLTRLATLARAIVDALTPRLRAGDPCIVIVDGDVAGVLGQRLERTLAGARPVICLDGIHVHEFDHLDVGTIVPRTRSVPVVVKSLVFSAGSRAAHQPARAEAPHRVPSGVRHDD